MPPGGIPQGGQLNQAHGMRWGDGSDATADTVFFDTLGNFIVHVGGGAGSFVLPGGQVIRSGSGAPAASLGDNGDVYFDKTAAATQFFYKKSGGAWSLLSGGSGGGGAPSGPAGGSLSGNYPNPTLASGVATGAVLGTDVVVTGSGAQTKTGILTVPVGTLSGSVLPTSSNVPSGSMAVYKDTGTGVITLYANDGGTIKTLGLYNVLLATDYGADPTGASDSTTAINNAIGALPATGGTIFFPTGTYLVNGTISIGNGSSSGVSTTAGIVLQGARKAAMNSFAGFTSAGGSTLKSGAATNLIAVKGPLQGWGIKDLTLDGNSTGTNGLFVLAGQGGTVENVVFQNFTGEAVVTESLPATGALSGMSPNTMHNNFRQITIILPNVGTANGVLYDGSASQGEASNPTSNSCYDNWDDLLVQFVGSNNNRNAIYLRDCDNIVFRHVEIIGAPGGLVGVHFDYVNGNSGGNWPADCLLDQIDFATNSQSVFNTGSPSASATTNRIINISKTNGQPANPLLANLNWGPPITPHGGEFINPTGAETAVVWRVPAACTVTGVYGFRTGGTGATINAEHSGNKLLASDFSVSSTGTWMSGGTVQNASLTVGEDLTIMLQSETGSPSGVAIQVDVQFQ